MESPEILLGEAEQVIRSVVRRKLHVTLQAADCSQRNTEAQDLLGEIRLRLFQKARTGQGLPAIADFRAYAARVAFNICADYLRSCHPERTRLKKCICRLLEKSDDFQLWRSSAGDLMCSLASQDPFNGRPVPRGRLLEAIESQRLIPSSIAKHHLRLTPDDWRTATRSVLTHFGAALSVDDLVSVLAPAVGMTEFAEMPLPPEEAIAEAPRLQSRQCQYSLCLTRERLKLLWKMIAQLLPWHRVSYLLNMTDGEIDLFPYYGVAGIRQIAASLALSPQQYRVLFRELGLDWDGQERTEVSSLLAKMWRFIPLPDNVIAAALEVSRAQVIGYRAKALQRLKRNLGGSGLADST